MSNDGPVQRALAAAAITVIFGAAALAEDSPHALGTASLPVFKNIAREQTPTVVSISARTRVDGWNDKEADSFRLFGLEPPPPRERVQRMIASGVIVNAAGEILTSNHAIEGADTLEVTLFGDEKTRYSAVRVGTDPVTDTALIRLEHPPVHLRAAVLGDSSALAPGDWIMAIGNPFHLAHSVAIGIVSFAGRPFEIQEGQWQDLLQLDAAINPGNSGGPLFDLRGEVVGINVGTLDTTMGSNVGISFAVPIDPVRRLLPELRRGRVRRGHLGGVRLLGDPMREDEARELGLANPRGAIVTAVGRDSAAARAGLRAGDVIVAMDRHPVTDARALVTRILLTPPGTCVTIETARAGKSALRTIVIDEWAGVRRLVASGPPDSTGGLTLQDLDAEMASVLDAPDPTGAVVVDVAPESAADEAALAPDDIILRINQQAVHTAEDAKRELAHLAMKRPVFLLIWRDGAELFVRLRRE